MTKHFTSATPPIPFTIDDDELEAYGQLSAEDFAVFATKLQQLGQKSSDTDADDIDMRDQVKAILEVVEMCVPEHTASIIAERIRSKDKPITFPVLLEVMNWVLEQYELTKKPGDADDKDPEGGARPTPPTPDSPTGSSDTGVGSAAT